MIDINILRPDYETDPVSVEILKKFYDDKKDMVSLRKDKYNQFLYFNNQPIKLPMFLAYYFETLTSEFMINVKYDLCDLFVSRLVQTYVKDEKEIAYLQMLEVTNPWESKFDSRGLMNKSMDEIIEDLYSVHAISEIYYPDSEGGPVMFLEHLYVDKEFIIDVYENKLHLEKTVDAEYAQSLFKRMWQRRKK